MLIFYTRQAAEMLLHITSNLNKLAIYYSWVLTSKSFMTVIQKKILIYCADIIAYF